MAEEPITQATGEPTGVVDTPAEPKPNATTDPDRNKKPETNEDFYWLRQAEKARKDAENAQREADELKAKLREKEEAELSEQEKLRREAEESISKATLAERRAERLQAIVDAELPKELAELVPEGIENPREYIESKILPLRDKIMKPSSFGDPTMPHAGAVPDEDVLLLKQYDNIRNMREKLEFYKKHSDKLRPLLIKRGSAQ